MDDLIDALGEPALRLECAMYAWHMRVVLTYLRDLGMDFDSAWSRALMSLPRPETVAGREQRQEWGALLHEQRATWQAMFERLPRPMLGDALPAADLAA